MQISSFDCSIVYLCRILFTEPCTARDRNRTFILVQQLQKYKIQKSRIGRIDKSSIVSYPERRTGRALHKFTYTYKNLAETAATVCSLPLGTLSHSQHHQTFHALLLGKQIKECRDSIPLEWSWNWHKIFHMGNDDFSVLHPLKQLFQQ